ncbi:MAG: hypothetical protein HKL80_03095 [Acidimicrobiales bacterium]|nr:hypothetical protein [Acidimicrobiales bacterium]
MTKNYPQNANRRRAISNLAITLFRLSKFGNYLGKQSGVQPMMPEVSSVRFGNN